MTLRDALRLGQDYLEGWLDSPRLECELLLVALLDRSRAELLAHPELVLKPAQEARFLDWLELRRIDYPLQHLRGFQEFYGRRFRVNREVLIPRPETETLIEVSLEWLADRRGGLLGADLGTGSGCLAVSLCCEKPGLRVVASDLHFPALKVAASNCRDWGCRNRVHLVCGDVWGFLDCRHRFDLIVSNPPYVRAEKPRELQSGVRDFEPHLALFGGRDGLDLYRRLLVEAVGHLAGDGAMILEIGADQEVAVGQLAEDTGWKIQAVRADLAGRARCLVLTHQEQTL